VKSLGTKESGRKVRTNEGIDLFSYRASRKKGKFSGKTVDSGTFWIMGDRLYKKKQLWGEGRYRRGCKLENFHDTKLQVWRLLDS